MHRQSSETYFFRPPADGLKMGVRQLNFRDLQRKAAQGIGGKNEHFIREYTQRKGNSN